MKLFLNELSIEPKSSDKYGVYDVMKTFAQTVSVAKKRGFRNIYSDLYPYQIELSPDYSFKNWLTDKDVSPDLKSFLFDFIKPPFIDENDEDNFEKYIDAQFFFEDTANNYPKTNCIGITAAHLYETMSISFNSAIHWRKTQLPLQIEIEEGTTTEQVFNVFTMQSFEDADLKIYVENLGELNLEETEIEPNDKSITLFGDHHGKEYLQPLADKLVNSPYVVEIKSTGFGGNSFIRKIFDNGVLEIVVMKRDERFALWVQTTGSNYRETEAIAQNLRERYS
jgi:hypothetical protein